MEGGQQALPQEPTFLPCPGDGAASLWALPGRHHGKRREDSSPGSQRCPRHCSISSVCMLLAKDPQGKASWTQKERLERKGMSQVDGRPRETRAIRSPGWRSSQPSLGPHYQDTGKTGGHSCAKASIQHSIGEKLCIR